MKQARKIEFKKITVNINTYLLMPDPISFYLLLSFWHFRSTAF